MKDALVEICALLNKHEVDYLLIGGVAVIYHGYTRSTADLDFWYDPTITNFHRIVNAVKEYGIDVSDLEKIVFDPKKTFLRFPASGFQAEFLPAIPGDLSFTTAITNAETLKINDTDVFIIAYEDLIKNKSATNRLKDQADVEELTKRRSGKRKGRGL